MPKWVYLSSLAALSSWCSCGPKLGPTIGAVASPTGSVGVELDLPVHGSSPDGHVTFDFDAPDLPDLKTRTLPATLTNYDQGEAVFRWIPIASDVGPHEIDLLASGNGVTSRVAAVVTVTPGTGAPPVFREPTGEGTTLELARGPCADVDVLVEDADQVAVALALAAPLVDNAVLQATSATEAILHFCPSVAQVAASMIFPLTLSAAAGGVVVEKTYTVVVRPVPMVTCTTAPPTIATAPFGDIKTTGDLHIIATIADDLGVVDARLLWTTTPPADPMNPDLNAFAPIAMQLTSGDPLSGHYDGYLPNPVVSSPPGTAMTIYYALAAVDDDPPLGCSHTTLSPQSGVYSFTVTRP